MTTVDCRQGGRNSARRRRNRRDVETASDCHVAEEAVHRGRGMQRSGHDNLRWKGCWSRQGWGSRRSREAWR
jgi:hypothetical protein